MKILIGYDGSTDSEGALRDLAMAGLPPNFRLKILTVTSPWQPQVPAP